MRIAVIGASGRGILVLEGLRRRPVGSAVLVGLAPGSEGESIAALADACHAASLRPILYDDYRQMLDQQKPEVVAVNPFFHDHEKIALELLRRRIHVFAEMPLALNLEGLARIRQAHAQSSAHLGCMLAMRYEPAMRAACRAVRSGAIGQVRLVHVQVSHRLDHPPDFFRDRATFGGLIPWMGSRAIDLIACMSGQPFVSVSAAHSIQGNRDHGELEVSAACLFRMGHEVVATATVDYLCPGASPGHQDDRVRVAGTEGVIEVVGGKATLIGADGVSSLEPNASSTLFGDFLDEIQGTGRCLVSTEEALMNTEASLRARQAADSGEIVFFSRD